MLVGHAVPQDGSGVQQPVEFRARWSSNAGSRDTKPVSVRGQSDSTGVFYFCGIPSGVTVTLSAAHDSLRSGESTIETSASPTVMMTLEVWSPSSPKVAAFRRRMLAAREAASDQPLPGVDVEDAATGRTLGVTSPAGSMSLATLERGRSLIRLRKVGYPQRIVMVDITPSDTMPLQVTLSTAVQLEAMKTTANANRFSSLREFAQRRKIGFGHFLSPDDFAVAENRPLIDFLGKMGMSRATLNGRDTFVGSRTGKFCPVSVYVDGTLFYSPGRQFGGSDEPRDYGRIYAGDYSAAEFYQASEAPMQFSITGVGGCGVLLLWTHR